MLAGSKISAIRDYMSSEPVEVVYLFGSQSTGDTHKHSDYDFGVVFSDDVDKRERFAKRLEYMGKLEKIIGSDNVEVIDLNSSSVYLRYSAIAPRHDIYVKNEIKRIDFEHTTLSHYFDRMPYLRRHTLGSLATIAREGL